MSDNPFEKKKRFNLSRVVIALLLVGSVTFVIAYYLPLSDAHSALAKQHESVATEQQKLTAQLKTTTEQLQTVQKERDSLTSRLGEIDQAKAAASKQVEELHAAVASALKKRTDRKTLRVEQDGATTAIVIEDVNLFRGHQVSVHSVGKAILCDVAKALKPLEGPITVTGHTADDSVKNSILRKDYSTALELSVARAASAALILKKCGVDGKRMAASGVGAHRPIEGTKKGSTGQVKIEVTVSQSS